MCHSCSKTCGGFQTRMPPVVWNPAGALTKSMVPPLRPSMTALVLNHAANSFGSVMAFQTTSLVWASHRSNPRVAYSLPLSLFHLGCCCCCSHHLILHSFLFTLFFDRYCSSASRRSD